MKSKAMNPVLDFINTLCNFVALNLVFLITCLPVITIGTALSSLYYVTLREARGEYGYLVRTYLREFKNNFKKGTIAFAILFLISGMGEREIQSDLASGGLACLLCAAGGMLGGMLA